MRFSECILTETHINVPVPRKYCTQVTKETKNGIFEEVELLEMKQFDENRFRYLALLFSTSLPPFYFVANIVAKQIFVSTEHT